MKIKFYLSFITIALLTLSSCVYHDDGPIVVHHNNPPPDPRVKFAGLYYASDACEFDGLDYDLIINIPAEETNRVLLEGDGIYGAGFSLNGFVRGRIIDIPVQTRFSPYDAAITYEFSGSAELIGDELFLVYDVFTYDNGRLIEEDYCDATALWVDAKKAPEARPASPEIIQRRKKMKIIGE